MHFGHFSPPQVGKRDLNFGCVLIVLILLRLIGWFYDISTLVVYLMPNPVYTISNTYDL